MGIDMTVRGIGVDIVHVPRISKVISRWGERFLKKIFTEREIELSSRRSRKDRFFALRFAAKEAFSKALGIGMRKPLTWHSIEVLSDDLGRPRFVLSMELERWCLERNIKRWHLSLSDDGEYGTAFVILEGE